MFDIFGRFTKPKPQTREIQLTLEQTAIVADLLDKAYACPKGSHNRAKHELWKYIGTVAPDPFGGPTTSAIVTDSATRYVIKYTQVLE